MPILNLLKTQISLNWCGKSSQFKLCLATIEVCVFYASASVGAFFYLQRSDIMPDYKTMYAKLFNAITDAVEILQEAQKATEEMYIESGEKEELRKTQLKILDIDK